MHDNGYTVDVFHSELHNIVIMVHKHILTWLIRGQVCDTALTSRYQVYGDSLPHSSISDWLYGILKWNVHSVRVVYYLVC